MRDGYNFSSSPKGHKSDGVESESVNTMVQYNHAEAEARFTKSGNFDSKANPRNIHESCYDKIF